ncbi:MAG: hypothetical protein HY423_01555 [Candidatus Lambdaproteobacteria bacterium]|nr:hypothetical protein [Candidatus Lambdaproteobacteria bacterium]
MAIGELRGDEDPSRSPFNTCSVDLRLADIVVEPKDAISSVDFFRGQGKISDYLADNSKSYRIHPNQSYTLSPGGFVLAKTEERVQFPVAKSRSRRTFGGRVEGRSSIARCGVLVHCTAPTIHANFEGTITLELVNLGKWNFLLYPGMLICQLMVEHVHGRVIPTPTQFIGQDKPFGR